MSLSEVARAAGLELVASEHVTVCFSTPARQKPSEGSGLGFWVSLWIVQGSASGFYQKLRKTKSEARALGRPFTCQRVALELLPNKSP